MDRRLKGTESLSKFLSVDVREDSLKGGHFALG